MATKKTPPRKTPFLVPSLPPAVTSRPLPPDLAPLPPEDPTAMLSFAARSR